MSDDDSLLLTVEPAAKLCRIPREDATGNLVLRANSELPIEHQVRMGDAA